MKNAVGREIPEKVGDYIVKPYIGAYATVPSDEPEHSLRTAARRAVKINSAGGGYDRAVVDGTVAGNQAADQVLPQLSGNISGSKILPDLKSAVLATGLQDGMTISFHHSFREGDETVGQVLTAIRDLGIKHLCFAPSAVVNIKNPSIVDFVKDGTIERIEASGIRGDLGDAVLEGVMENPVILRTHGSRPRAIEAGELNIDVAFISASAADEYGNATGQIGPNACGSLGYSFIDAVSAKRVVVITDYLVDYPCNPASISQQYVDFVVKVDRIGDPDKIGKGAARMTKNPRDLMIAERAADVIAASRLFKDHFSFQTGAGAISIACTNYLAERMEERGVKAGFALGGMTAAIVEMYQKGLVRVLECSQCFDAVSARAIAEHPGIVEIDNAVYSNPFSKGSMLDKLNFGVLGALEVDTDFNVNILTGSSGEMMGGLGGGPDVAAGSDISVVCLPVVRGRTPSITRKVFTCCTPGETVAVVVTEAGIALNPKHKYYAQLKEDLEKANLKLVTIEYLQQLAESLTGVPKPIETTDRVVCIVEYRDGTVIDVIREIKK